MRLFLIFSFGYLLGIASPTMYTVTKELNRRLHNAFVVPKYKVGDCVSTYGFKPFKIIEIFQDPSNGLSDYEVSLSATCSGPKYECRDSIYDIETVDREGKLMECK